MAGRDAACGGILQGHQPSGCRLVSGALPKSVGQQVIVRDIISLLPTEPANELELRDPRNISMLVVHWSGDSSPIPDGYDSMQHAIDEAEYHIGKDWSEEAGRQGGFGLMYHEVIDRYGRVFLTRPDRHVVWACMGANAISYNLCLDATVGSPPTALQKRVLPLRLNALRVRYGVPLNRVAGHGELTAYGNQTSCPGSQLQLLLAEYRGGG